jgi:zinc transport system ATP-binding protein
MTTATEPLLRGTGVSVRYGELSVLDAVDITIHEREILTLVGLNGSGKTTLVRCLLGLLQPHSGEVWRRPGLRVGFAPQQLHRDSTLPLTVGRFLGLGGRYSRVRLQSVMAEVGVEDVLGRQLADISGGELRRVLLARALLRDPDLLVLDEPLAGVDVSGQTDLYRLIGDIRDRHGVGVLLVSHELHIVMAATDTVVCLNHHVCCTGRPASVARNPAFVSLFGSHVADVLAIYPHHHDHHHDVHGVHVPDGVGDAEGQPATVAGGRAS